MSKKKKQPRSQRIKSLETKYWNLRKEVDASSDRRGEEKQKHEELIREATAVQEEIDGMKEQAKETKLIVSEHAVLRYLERVQGIDMKAIRDEILDPIMIAKVKTLGDGKYPCRDGAFKVLVKDGVITSVVSK